ncbi:MAG: biopolymer transporter ExbD [Verrucomicrobiales bacterium]|nr:biopolymer transporter ExbD [Verrucomicrobiae bacterium]
MQRTRRRTEDEVTFQLTPMIDMTFLLLIFFMVTARLTDQKVSIPLELPQAENAVDPDTQDNREIINIDAEGTYYIGDQSATDGELKAYLLERFKTSPPLRIYVRADRKARSEQTKKLVRMATEAGATHVIVGTLNR